MRRYIEVQTEEEEYELWDKLSSEADKAYKVEQSLSDKIMMILQPPAPPAPPVQ